MKLRKSRHCFLIKKEDLFLAYTSAGNSFYKISEFAYDLIANLDMEEDELEKAEYGNEIRQLKDMRLVSTGREDDEAVDLIRLRYLTNSFRKDTIKLTLAPTLRCNLNCPYCYEKNKPFRMMDEKTCDAVISFIRNHTESKYLVLTWYGGEPLLGADIIDYFLSKTKELKDIRLTSHTMVTNGTLFNESNLELFKKYPLNSVQITLDGLEETHDKRRIRHDGSGTFSTIVENIGKFAEHCPDTSISIRVNIDKDNAHEFMGVYGQMKRLFPQKKNLFVYPGILRQCGGPQWDSPFLANEDISRLKQEFVSQGYPISFPDFAVHGCCATCLTGYVIGPEGEIYKCWEDVGDEKLVVGNVVDLKYTNMPLLAQYMLHGSRLMEEECMACPLLPICSNDCPKFRLSNKLHGSQNELCCIYKSKDYETLSEWLYEYYLLKNRTCKEGNTRQESLNV